MADLRSTLFVGNLSVFCTEQDIESLFSTYGVILEIRMAKSEDKSKHLSYGFVKFASVASAQLAMHELNGALLCGRPLKIGKAFSRSNKKSLTTAPNEPEYNTASVHVTFISHQLTHVVNEESLRQLFSQFGVVVDAVICKSNIDQQQGRQSGYGFIHFPGNPQGIDSSFRAAEVLMDVMIDDVNYKCKISHHLEKHLRDPAAPAPPSSAILPASAPPSVFNAGRENLLSDDLSEFSLPSNFENFSVANMSGTSGVTTVSGNSTSSFRSAAPQTKVPIGGIRSASSLFGDSDHMAGAGNFNRFPATNLGMASNVPMKMPSNVNPILSRTQFPQQSQQQRFAPMQAPLDWQRQDVFYSHVPDINDLFGNMSVTNDNSYSRLFQFNSQQNSFQSAPISRLLPMSSDLRTANSLSLGSLNDPLQLSLVEGVEQPTN